jgi:rSAM/selenodomain-associated transferase 1
MSSARSVSSSAVNGSIHRGGCALAIMLKAPVEGQVKTRLSPPLSPQSAAGLSRRMIRDTADNIAGVCLTMRATGVAVFTPAGAEAAIDPLLPAGFARVVQRGEAFGERLANAAADLLGLGFTSLCLIDSDSPTLPPATLAAAVRALEGDGDRSVIAGADDGGYCLIGLKAAHPEVFAGIDWSTSRVYRQTLQRAAAAGLDMAELPGWYDVDDRATLRRLCDELLGSPVHADGGYPAPHTRRFLLGLAAELDGIGRRPSGADADAR